jgi:molecular chaperone DnaK
MSKMVGIDLGVSKCSLSFLENGKPKTMSFPDGSFCLPTVITIQESGNFLYGNDALKKAIMYPETTIYDFLRLLGKPFNSDYVQKMLKYLPYTVSEDVNGLCLIEAFGKKYNLTKLTSMFLSRLRNLAEDFLQEDVTDALFSVRSKANRIVRQSIQDASKRAGINCVRILSKAVASAVSSAWWREIHDLKTFATFELGSGSIDCCFVQIEDGIMEIISVNSEEINADEDVDLRILESLSKAIKTQFGKNIFEDKIALINAKQTVEQTKIALSNVEESHFHLPTLSVNDAQNQFVLDRGVLLKLNEHLLNKISAFCTTSLADSNLPLKTIDEIVINGGLSRMPMVQNEISKVFQNKKIRNYNLDEAVSFGLASVCACILGEIKDYLLLDVYPFSIGIETQDTFYSPIIYKNTLIPTKVSKIYTTSKDNQNELNINFVEGENGDSNDSLFLGNLKLTNIKPSPKGVPQIEVTLNIDAYSKINVFAKELGTENTIWKTL